MASIAKKPAAILQQQQHCSGRNGNSGSGSSCRSSRKMIADRALGSLLGQAVGDALGFRYQYRSGEDVRSQIAMDRDNAGFLPIRGSTVFDFPPGQVSDNSELCMVLARSLCKTGKVSTYDIIGHLIRWANSNPLNMDETVINALNCKGRSYHTVIKTPVEQIEQRILSNAYRRNVCNLSNKCLFLAVPLAIASVHSDGVNAALCRVGRLMQPNPVAVDALRVLITAIQSLILQSDVELAYDYAYNTSRTHPVREHILQARIRANPQTVDDECCSSSDEEHAQFRIDYLGIALQCAFYQLMHATNFMEGVVAALQIGGDTTANAAITAALLGARFGSSTIPKQWKDTVTKAKLDRHCTLPDVYFGDITNVVDKLLTIVTLQCC